MRRVIFYFIILVLAIWVGLRIHADSGYVLISYGHWTIETSLWFALLALIITLSLIHFIILISRKGLLLPSRLRNHLLNRKKDHTYKIATGLMQADEHMQNTQYEAAISTLKTVRTLAPKNLTALHKLSTAYDQLNDYDSLQGLLPEIKKQLQKTWDTRLIDDYFNATNDDTSKKSKQAKKWLKAHPNDITLLRILARLCIEQTLWGQARDYLQQAIAIEENPTLFSMLGHVYEKLDDQTKALEYYRRTMKGT